MARAREALVYKVIGEAVMRRSSSSVAALLALPLPVQGGGGQRIQDLRLLVSLLWSFGYSVFSSIYSAHLWYTNSVPDPN